MTCFHWPGLKGWALLGGRGLDMFSLARVEGAGAVGGGGVLSLIILDWAAPASHELDKVETVYHNHRHLKCG